MNQSFPFADTPTLIMQCSTGLLGRQRSSQGGDGAGICVNIAP
jgi:hypothetical protein